MKKSIYLPLIIAMSGCCAATAQQHYNMVKTMKAVKTLGTGNAILPSNGIVTIQYYDDLGRPEQEVMQGVTPQGRDLVTLHEYDGFGRDSRTWLPVTASSGNNGKPLGASSVATLAVSAYGDNAAYSYNVYEQSVLNRPVEQYGAGKAWHDNGKCIKTEYLKCSNNTAELKCRIYKASTSRISTTITSGGSYADNSLAVTKTTDEDGKNIVLEFKDNNDHTVLTRKISGSSSLDTYYIYDIYGNLRAVLPPAASSAMSANGSWAESTDAVAKFAYLYKYDTRNRMTGKKLPGTGWATYCYDGADRMIFSQSPVQAEKSPKEYTFYMYDNLDRPVVEGRCSDAGSYSITVKATLSRSSSGSVVATGIGQSGYTVNITLQSPAVDKVVYYDSYGLTQLEGFQLLSLPSTVCNATGFVTATRTAVNDGSGKYVYAMNFYDRYGRVSETNSTNTIGGTDNVKTAYTFTGNPQTVTITHKSKYLSQNKTLTYRYTYDSADRLKTVTLSDGNTTRTISSLQYDELCRISKDTRTGLQALATSYGYDIRSRMTSINNPNFSSTLKYNYNSSISEIKWKGSADIDSHIYRLGYGSNGSLGSATYSTESCSDNLYGTLYSYDDMGNLKQLTRYGRTYNNRYSCADLIWYTYDGNHIIKAYSSMIGNSYYGAMHFKNGANEDIEYFYDSNGNTIKDLNRGIADISYDNNNLPAEVTFNDGSTINTVYDADGNKLSVTHQTLLSPVNMPMLEIMDSYSDEELTYNALAAQDTAYVTTALKETIANADNTDSNDIRLKATANSNTEKTVTDYCGSFIYQNGILDKILFEGGYITYNGSTPTFHFYIQDHLGNNRAVVNHSGTLEQETHYYPFGAINGALSTNPEFQPYKFTGKELDRTNGYDMMDYGARMYAADLGRWMVMDPWAEKYYDVSPYAYCGNAPVNNIDPDGRMYDWYQNNSTKYYTWFEGNGEKEGFTHIGGKGSVLGEFEQIIDNILISGFNRGSMFSDGFTFDIAPNDKGALIGSKERDADFFDEFINGTGPEVSVFLSDHPYTRDLKKDEFITKYHSLIKTGNTDIAGLYTNVHRDWGVLDVVTTWSLARQFVGTYRYDGFTSRDGQYINNVISDSKSLYSLLYHIYPSKWNIDRIQQKEFGNTYQFYIWKSKKH